MGNKKKSDTAAIAAVAKQTEKLKQAAEEMKLVGKIHSVLKDLKMTEKTKSSEKTEKTKSNEKTENTKSTDTKEKRPPNAYQIFRKQKLEELREEYDDEETRPSYQDLMKMVIEAWHEENPKKEKIPKEKKERKQKSTDDNEPKKKRAPSAYNIFIKEIMPSIKSEHEHDEPKLSQKDYMKLAAEKWNEHKLKMNI